MDDEFHRIENISSGANRAGTRGESEIIEFYPWFIDISF